MEILKCPNCFESFKFPCRLKKHLEISTRCKIHNNEITTFMSQIQKKNIIKKHINNKFQCVNCNKIFRHNSSLYRHNKNCNPNEHIDIDNINFGQIILINPSIKGDLINLITINLPNQNMPNYIDYIYSLSINTIRLFNESLATSITKLIKSSKQQTSALGVSNIANTSNIAITNNNNNSTNSTNTDNSINNSNNSATFNNCNFYHILPFGSENINRIPKTEMLRILRCGDSCSIEILQAVYKYEENRNFYRSNLKNTGITFLDNSHKLKVYKLQDFLYDVFNSCLNLIDQMLYVCRNDMSIEEINNVIMNRDRIEYSLFNEIHKQINSLVESEISNNNLKTREKTKKYIEKITQSAKLKEEADTLMQSVIRRKTETYLCKTKYTITQADLDAELGNPKEVHVLNQININEDFLMQRTFEKTQFYLHWIERIKEEREYIENKKQEGLTIQDIKNHYERIRKIINNVKIMRQRHSDYNGVGNVNIDLEDLEDSQIFKVIETVKNYISERDTEIDDELNSNNNNNNNNNNTNVSDIEEDDCSDNGDENSNINNYKKTKDLIGKFNIMDELIIVDDSRNIFF